MNNIKSMMKSIKEGNVNNFQKSFGSQVKENIGKSIELKKEQVATTMFNKKG